MQLDDQYTFLKRRLDLEQSHFDSDSNTDVLKSISSIDITTTDLCNRTCVFCPRHDPKVYPNRNLRMTKDGAEIISKRISELDYSGTIAISGFGENLLNPEIVDIVRVLREYNPKAHIECNTNGDPLTSELASRLVEAGLTCLNVNLYDSEEQVDKFKEMLKDISDDKFKLRAHWKSDDYGIIYNNRSGVIKWLKRDDLTDVKNKPCYYPFYKLFIDWNGDVLFCANDWGRVRVVGNLLQQSIRSVWMSTHMKKIRMRLAEADRNFKPCDGCSVNGTLIGKPSFDILMDHYENRSNG